MIIKFADRIAYINHDIDDAVRGNVIKEDDIPRELSEVLGYTHSNRINTMVTSVIEGSRELDDIKMTPEVWDATNKLRNFLFERVYYNSSAEKPWKCSDSCSDISASTRRKCLSFTTTIRKTSLSSVVSAITLRA